MPESKWDSVDPKAAGQEQSTEVQANGESVDPKAAGQEPSQEVQRQDNGAGTIFDTGT